MLSPNASNFVPRQQSTRQPMPKSSLSPYVKEFVPLSKMKQESTEEQIKQKPPDTSHIRKEDANRKENNISTGDSHGKFHQDLSSCPSSGNTKSSEQRWMYDKYPRDGRGVSAKTQGAIHYPATKRNWRDWPKVEAGDNLSNRGANSRFENTTKISVNLQQKSSAWNRPSNTLRMGLQSAEKQTESGIHFGKGRGRGSALREKAKEIKNPGEKLQKVDVTKTSKEEGSWRQDMGAAQDNLTKTSGSKSDTTADVKSINGNMEDEWTVVSGKKRDSKRDEVKNKHEGHLSFNSGQSSKMVKKIMEKVGDDESTKGATKQLNKPLIDQTDTKGIIKQVAGKKSPFLKRKDRPIVSKDAWARPQGSKDNPRNADHSETRKNRQYFENLKGVKESLNKTEERDNVDMKRWVKDRTASSVKDDKNHIKPNSKQVPISITVNNNRDAKKIWSKESNLSLSDITDIQPKTPVFVKEEFPDLSNTKQGENQSTLTSDWLSGGTRMPILSYSAALKTKPQPRQLPDSREKPGRSSSQGSTEQENQSVKKKKKRKKKKKPTETEGESSTTKQQPMPTKKTKEPLQFDLGMLLSSVQFQEVRTKDRKEKQVKKAVVAGTLPTQIANSAAGLSKGVPQSAKPGPPVKVFHNMLDSTAPVIKRGKEREVPKKKKPSALKRIILKEREEKKKERENAEHEKTDDGDASGAEIASSNVEMADEEIKDQVEPPNTCTTQEEEQGKPNDALSLSTPSDGEVKAKLHSRRFRDYCDQVLDKELNTVTLKLLSELVRFQDRVYFKDPEKAKAKRRYVVGLREVTKHLKLKKIKCVILSPNIEQIKSAGGLDDALHNIISLAHTNGIPVVFSLRRQILGRAVCKKVPVSAVGIFNYDGAQDLFKNLMELTENGRKVYAERWNAAQEALREELDNEHPVISCNTEQGGPQEAQDSRACDGEHSDDGEADDGSESGEESEGVTSEHPMTSCDTDEGGTQEDQASRESDWVHPDDFGESGKKCVTPGHPQAEHRPQVAQESREIEELQLDDGESYEKSQGATTKMPLVVRELNTAEYTTGNIPAEEEGAAECLSSMSNISSTGREDFVPGVEDKSDSISTRSSYCSGIEKACPGEMPDNTATVSKLTECTLEDITSDDENAS